MYKAVVKAVGNRRVSRSQGGGPLANLSEEGKLGLFDRGHN
jgi:hypothetical protein